MTTSDQPSLENLWLLNICLIAFTGFMTFSKVTSVKGCDIIFTETYMKIFIEKDKTDIYREGAWVYISRSHNIFPVKLLEDYLRLVNINISSSQYIFRAISKGKKSRLRRKNNPISYTTICQNLLKFITAVGLNWKDYGLHSFWAVGASLAANKKATDRLFKCHGWWKSDRAKDSYIEDDLKMLLPVLKNLQN